MAAFLAAAGDEMRSEQMPQRQHNDAHPNLTCDALESDECKEEVRKMRLAFVAFCFVLILQLPD
jgi:hypothetical protein